MKKILSTITGILLTSVVWAQTAQAEQRCRSITIGDYGYPSNTCLFPGGGGVFQNAGWEISILHYEEDYHIYYGRDRRTGNSLQLDISEISGTTTRSQYIARNGQYRYVVTIQPLDPNVIRLEVYQGQRVLLNQLLYKIGDSGDASRRMFN